MAQSLSSLQRVFKVDYIILPLFLVPKLRSVAQNEWNSSHIYFFYYWFKYKQVSAERIGKNQKKIQIPKT